MRGWFRTLPDRWHRCLVGADAVAQYTGTGSHLYSTPPGRHPVAWNPDLFAPGSQTEKWQVAYANVAPDRGPGNSSDRKERPFPHPPERAGTLRFVFPPI